MRAVLCLCLIFLSCSFKLSPKICANCKYFINDENMGAEYGKCSAFPLENVKYLIDGVIRNNEYRYCSSARSYEDLCGKSGKKYSKKYSRTIKNKNDESK